MVARTGGRVIKNVAGYDLARLYCGSFGTLGLVAELALRVHPVRPHSRTLRVPCPPGAVAPLLGSLRAAGVEATALDWTGPVAPAALVRVEQRTERAAAAQADAARRAARAEGLGAELLEATGRARGLALGRRRPGRLARRHRRADRDPAARAWPGWRRAAAEACARSGTELAFVSHAPLGLHTARLRGGRPAEVVAALRRAVAVRRRLRGHPPAGRPGAGVDRWGTAPGRTGPHGAPEGAGSTPAGRLAPGTFVGGI